MSATIAPGTPIRIANTLANAASHPRDERDPGARDDSRVRRMALIVGRRGLATLVAAAMLFSISGAAEADENVRRQVKGKFEDVKASLVAAIEGKGLVINTVAHVGDMLARTGQDLGATKRIYEKAEVLEFCSATVSRATMEADPHAIVHCPYTIAVYVIAGQPGTVYVAYRKPRGEKPGPAADALALVGKLLDEIVGEALLF